MSVACEVGVSTRPAPTRAPGSARLGGTADDDPYAIGEQGGPVTGDLWLSRVELGLRSSDARAVLGDAYARHRLVLKAFPGLTRQQAGVLHHYTPPQ